MSVGTVQSTFSLNIPIQKTTDLASNGYSFVQNTFDQLSNFWRYAAKVIGMSKQSLKIFVRVHPNGSFYEKVVSKLLAQLKIPSIYSGAKNCKPFYSDLTNTFQYVKEGDYSSATFSGISASLSGADAFDSFSTFIEGYRYLRDFPPIQWLGKYGKPIGLYLSIMGSVSRLFKICHASDLFEKSERLEKLTDQPEKFKREIQEFLNEKVGLTLEEHLNFGKRVSNLEEKNKMTNQLLVRKQRNCIRNTNKKVFQQLKDLHDLFQQGKLKSLQDQKKAIAVIQNIRTSILGNVISHIIAIAANIFTLVGLILLSYTSVIASWIPFAFLLAGITVRLVNIIYEDSYKKSFIQEVDLSTLSRPVSA